MTAGKAIELADQMRPNNEFSSEMKRIWLRQADARLREMVVARNDVGTDFDTVGADKADAMSMDADCVLLAPAAFDALYPHWLAAQIDLALGETDRASNELQLYSDAVQDFMVWLRRKYPPMQKGRFRY